VDATRSRASFVGEWAIAGAFFLATVGVTLLVVRELRTTPSPGTPSATNGPVSAAVPPGAVSVPALTLGGQQEVQVGELYRDVAQRIDREVVLVKTVTERGPLGTREVRSYQLAGTRFILVLEPFERGGEPRVAAIYVQ